MANFRGHMTAGVLSGIGCGAGSVVLWDFSPEQGALAGCLTAVGAILPDLDLGSSTPSRELFSMTAALAPLVLMDRLTGWAGTREGTLLLAVGVYLAVRYAGAALFNKLSVHRGMFHSIPALLISAEVTFLAYQSELLSVKLLMAGGIAAGFLSHLILDEIYSVQFSGVRVRLAKSAGSALKFFGNNLLANFAAYGLLAAVTYTALIDGGWIEGPPLSEAILNQVEYPTDIIRR